MSYVPTQPKLIGETLTLEYDFQGQMLFGETLDPPLIASVAVTLFSGFDNSPSSILTGPVTVSGTTVSTAVTGGMAGVIYILTFHAAGSSGAVYRGTRYLAVLNNDGSFVPSSIPTLTGDLPDGIVGAAYSHNLTIAGGYLPYATATPTGSAPEWMGFTIVGNSLVCAGTSSSDALASYSFNARIQDAALTFATSAQVINLTRTTVAGDLPNLSVGETPTFSYTASLGTSPYTFAIIGGTLPTGLTLNSNGSISGTATTPGNFSWTVRGTDVNGITDDHNDSATVELIGWMATYNGGSIKLSPDGNDWSAAGSKPSDGSGIIWSPIAGAYLVRASNGDILASCVSSEVVPTAVNVALRSAAGVWTRSTYAGVISADAGETIYTGTHYFMIGGVTTGESKISSTGASFTNIASLRCDMAALGNSFVIGTGGYFGSLDTKKIALDGSSFSAGTSISTGDSLAQRGADSDTLSPRRVCFAGVLGGGGGAGVIGIYSTNNDASTWASHTNPFPAGHGLTFTSLIRVHYGLDRWFIFAGKRVAYGSTLGALVLDTYVFPQNVNNVDSDFEKLIVCGDSGMLQKWTPAGGWVALTSGISSAIFDIVSSPEL